MEMSEYLLYTDGNSFYHQHLFIF